MSIRHSDLQWAGSFTVNQLCQLARQLKIDSRVTKVVDLAHGICNELHRRNLRVLEYNGRVSIE